MRSRLPVLFVLTVVAASLVGFLYLSTLAPYNLTINGKFQLKPSSEDIASFGINDKSIDIYAVSKGPFVITPEKGDPVKSTDLTERKPIEWDLEKYYRAVATLTKGKWLVDAQSVVYYEFSADNVTLTVERLSATGLILSAIVLIVYIVAAGLVLFGN